MRKFLGTLIALAIAGVWMAAAAIGGPYFGKVEEVSSNDQSVYLPASAEATQVRDELTDFLGDNTIPAIVIVTSDTELEPDTLAELASVIAEVGTIAGVESASPPIPSEDGKAVSAFLSIDTDSSIKEVVGEMRAELDALIPAGLNWHVTGPAGFTTDLAAGFAGIDGLLLIVALSAVLIILILVYRSFLLPIAVLLTSVSALCAALLTVWWLAKGEILLLTGQTQGILFILVIGAATDYALLYTARFSEELRRLESVGEATRASIKGSAGAILASGGTVAAGLLCLMFSDLGSNSSLGPVAAIGIGFAVLSALTLLPALLKLMGRAAYWPRKPQFDDEFNEDKVVNEGLYAKIGAWVARRPRAIWIGSTLILLVGAAFLPQLKADGVPSSEFVIGASDARDGQAALSEHFPGGSGTPVYVITDEAKLQSVADRLLANDGIDSVAVTANDAASGTLQVTSDGIQQGWGVPAEPTIRNGDVLLQATLLAASDSVEAQQTVVELRDALAGDALVGGQTAITVDTNTAAIHDRNLIIPLVLVVILLILIVLLRSIVAPLLLVGTTVLSFVAVMGVSALLFNGVFAMPGADPSVPLYGFVFLVALGVDYNIFLMTRVREEAVTHATKAGVLRGLSLTGGVITAAGVVLAATFAALSVIPILFLLQLAFIVAFGVLLDTLLVRTLLVPALSLEIGRAVWWPSKLSKIDA